MVAAYWSGSCTNSVELGLIRSRHESSGTRGHRRSVLSAATSLPVLRVSREDADLDVVGIDDNRPVGIGSDRDGSVC